MEAARKIKSVCWWCKAKCYVVVHTDKDGILTRITKDLDRPGHDHVAKRITCPHREAAQQWFYSPNRLNYPLKRKGERGQAEWEIISWNQAMAEIAERLEKIREEWGPEALVATNGDYWTHTEYCQRFMSLFGSPNHIGPSPICMGPRALIPRAVMGWAPAHYISPDTRCVVLYGCEAMVGRPRHWTMINEIREKGAKIIVIDPRETNSVAVSDAWLQLRPGTDAFLLMSMINYIIENELYDKAFVDQWCHGFNMLKGRAKKYSLEKAEEVTWVPKEAIAGAAKIYASTKPGVILEGMGIEQQVNASANMYARCALAAITGNIDVAGGEALTGPHRQYVSDREIEMWEQMPQGQKVKQLGSDRFKMHCWPGQKEIHDCLVKTFGSEADHAVWYLGQAHAPTAYRAMLSGKPYPVRAMVTQASNPLVSQANTKLVYKAVKSLDLYVVMDQFMTPSALLADYVLPATSWLERPHVDSYLGYGTFIRAHKASVPSVVEGMYDRRTDFYFWRELGIRLGQEEYWPWETIEESYTDRLREKKYTFEEFVDKVYFEIDNKHEPKRYEKIGFATPTGKVELASTIFEKLGFDPIPEYAEARETPLGNPELVKEYPLIMTSAGRDYAYIHTNWKDVPWIRRVSPEPLVEIHPETAKKLGVEDDEWVWIETPRGRIRQKAFYKNTLHPQVVAVAFDWWLPELPEEEPWLMGLWESNMNVLMDDHPDDCDPMLGSWPLRICLCKIYPVRKGLNRRKHRIIEKNIKVFDPQIVDLRGQ